jgi:ankyrin repeat protein
LIRVAHEGYGVTVQALIESGANLKRRGKCGQMVLPSTLIRTHCSTNLKAVLQLLQENGSNIEEIDKCGRTPLVIAAGSGQETIVQLLVENGAI